VKQIKIRHTPRTKSGFTLQRRVPAKKEFLLKASVYLAWEATKHIMTPSDMQRSNCRRQSGRRQFTRVYSTKPTRRLPASQLFMRCPCWKFHEAERGKDIWQKNGINQKFCSAATPTPRLLSISCAHSGLYKSVGAAALFYHVIELQ
jgi:hypothetical protein